MFGHSSCFWPDRLKFRLEFLVGSIRIKWYVSRDIKIETEVAHFEERTYPYFQDLAPATGQNNENQRIRPWLQFMFLTWRVEIYPQNACCFNSNRMILVTISKSNQNFPFWKRERTSLPRSCSSHRSEQRKLANFVLGHSSCFWPDVFKFRLKILVVSIRIKWY